MIGERARPDEVSKSASGPERYFLRDGNTSEIGSKTDVVLTLEMTHLTLTGLGAFLLAVRFTGAVVSFCTPGPERINPRGAADAADCGWLRKLGLGQYALLTRGL